jgi:hypothetical protein
MTDTAFQADAFQNDAFQIEGGGSGGGDGLTGGSYTYIPNSRSAKKIRKLLERQGEPLAREFEAKAPVDPVAPPAEIDWPEGYRTRKPRVLPPKPENKLKWWPDAQAEPLPKQDSFEWWDKNAKPAEPQWNASGKSKFEWWKT